MTCPLCQTALNNKIDNYYFTCSKCDAYVKDKQYYISKNLEKERYQEHNNDVNDLAYQKFTAPITNAILEEYSPQHLGLDYGCGTGPVITKLLKDQNYNVHLFDPYFHPNTNYQKHQYDYIFSCEVFEHFYQPKLEIEKLLSLLKPNGLLLIKTHLYQSGIDFTNWYYRNDPTHVFIYTEKTIRFIAKKYQLKIEKLTERLVFLRK